MRQRLTSLTLLPLVILLVATTARADLSRKQARQAITKMAGMSLPSSAVRVRSVSSSSNTSGEALAQLELVFRMARDEEGLWRVREVRTGDARWDEIELLRRAANLELSWGQCHFKDEDQRYVSESELSTKLARCLVASLFNVSLPSDAVRIKNISPLNFGNRPSAIVVALVDAQFRLNKGARGWSVVAIQGGHGDWVSIENVQPALEELKRFKTIESMNEVVRALHEYRLARGTYVVTDKHRVAVDHLNPRFLNRVIRLDMWQRPFVYQGSQDHFTLRSLGPDGKENTADDIVVSR